MLPTRTRYDAKTNFQCRHIARSIVYCSFTRSLTVTAIVYSCCKLFYQNTVFSLPKRFFTLLCVFLSEDTFFSDFVD